MSAEAGWGRMRRRQDDRRDEPSGTECDAVK